MPKENLRFSKGTEVLIPRVGEDPMDYNHCTWLSIPNVAIGEMISVYNTMQNPLFTATMFNATLQKEFAMRVEGGSVTNLYYEKLKNIQVSFPKYEHYIADQRYATIAKRLGLPADTTQEGVNSLVKAVLELNATLEEERSLKDCGIDEAEFLAKVDMLADRAFEDQCTSVNPRVPLVTEIKQILLDAYYGKEIK
jgi:hypothetical protein